MWLSLEGNAGSAFSDPKRALELTAAMLERSLPHERGPLLAIGISVPADIDPSTSLIESAPTLPRWVGLPIRSFFAERFGVRAFIDNDVNVLALAEASRPGGGDRSGATFLVVRISSGVGCGIVIDGVVFRGSRGFAGDIGHISADPSNPTLCACGNRGCLEALAAAPAIIRGAEAVRAEYGSALTDFMSESAPLTLDLISSAAQAGTRTSAACFEPSAPTSDSSSRVSCRSSIRRR